VILIVKLLALVLNITWLLNCFNTISEVLAMTTLFNRSPRDSFPELLKLSTSGATQTLQSVEDGNGAALPLKLSTLAVAIHGLAFPSSGAAAGKILAVAANGVSMEWKTQAPGGVTSINNLTGSVTLTSSDIAEGTNLYYTSARFDSALAGKSTTNLAEGTNQYFTNARARSAISLSAGISSATYNSTTGVLDTSSLASMNVAQTFTKGQAGSITTPTFSSPMTLNLVNSNNFRFTATSNFTMTFPANPSPGQSGLIIIVQDGTGSRVVTWASGWVASGGTKPVLSTAANTVDYISYFVETTGRVYVSIAPAVS
jgi:hypothetical protein